MNYYDVLEVAPTASQEVIKAAYKSLAQKYHPDRNKSKDAVTNMQNINVAYSVLSDINKRKDYDSMLNESKATSNMASSEDSTDNLENIKIDIQDPTTSKTDTLELSTKGILFKGNTLLSPEIDFIAINVLDQRTTFKNFGGKFEIMIGNCNKTIKIIIDNKNYNGNDEVFSFVCKQLYLYFSKNIILKIVNAVIQKGGYSINGAIEFNSKGVFSITNKNKHTNINKVLITYEHLQIEIDSGKSIFINKKTLDRFEIDNFKNTKNAILLTSIIETLKENELGNKESPEIKKWNEEFSVNEKNKTEEDSKNKKISFLLLLTMGGIGAHRFYYGNWIIGVLLSFTFCKVLVNDKNLLGTYALSVIIIESLLMYGKNIKDKRKNDLAGYKIITSILQSIFSLVIFLAISAPSKENKQYESKTESAYPINTSIVQEPNLQDALKYYKNGYDKKALNILNLLAKKNNPEEQFYIGTLYDRGDGLPQSYSEAVKWYTLAANNGHSIAQFNLGNMTSKGEGTPKNDAQAFKWYTLAANQGHSESQNLLANMYANGIATVKNENEAYRLYLLSANNGNPSAQFNLGVMYNVGIGVAQNLHEAAKWYTLAANNGHSDAQYNLALMYSNGIGVSQNLNEAFRLYNLSAHQGNPNAQYNLGVMYEEGKIVDKNYFQALKWYNLAAGSNLANAQYNLGTFYMNGWGVNKDKNEATRWYKLAANQGYAPAQYMLSTLLLHNVEQESSKEETSKKINESMYWLKQSAQQNYVPAIQVLEKINRDINNFQSK